MMKQLMLGTVAVVTALAITPAVAGPRASSLRPTVSNFSRPTISSARPALSTQVPTAHSRLQLGTSSTYRWNGRTVDPLPGGAGQTPTLTTGKIAGEVPQLTSQQKPRISTFGSLGRAVDPLPGGGTQDHHVLLPTTTAYDNSNVIMKVEPPVHE